MEIFSLKKTQISIDQNSVISFHRLLVNIHSDKKKIHSITNCSHDDTGLTLTKSLINFTSLDLLWILTLCTTSGTNIASEGPFTPTEDENKSEIFLWCLTFFPWSLSLVLWSFSLSRSLSLSVNWPLFSLNFVFLTESFRSAVFGIFQTSGVNSRGKGANLLLAIRKLHENYRNWTPAPLAGSTNDRSKSSLRWEIICDSSTYTLSVRTIRRIFKRL